jgi:hypothetical protein
VGGACTGPSVGAEHACGSNVLTGEQFSPQPHVDQRQARGVMLTTGNMSPWDDRPSHREARLWWDPEVVLSLRQGSMSDHEQHRTGRVRQDFPGGAAQGVAGPGRAMRAHDDEVGLGLHRHLGNGFGGHAVPDHEVHRPRERAHVRGAHVLKILPTACVTALVEYGDRESRLRELHDHRQQRDPGAGRLRQ